MLIGIYKSEFKELIDSSGENPTETQRIYLTLLGHGLYQHNKISISPDVNHVIFPK